jgi:hypothetical protein
MHRHFKFTHLTVPTIYIRVILLARSAGYGRDAISILLCEGFKCINTDNVKQESNDKGQLTRSGVLGLQGARGSHVEVALKAMHLGVGTRVSNFIVHLFICEGKDTSSCVGGRGRIGSTQGGRASHPESAH